jgi:teichuronic acid biosynthesis glycosyltransferase TuaC
MQALIARGHEFRVVRVVPHAPGWTARWRAYRAIPDEYIWDGQPVRSIRAFVPPRNVGLGLTRAQIRATILAEITSFRPDLIHAHGVIPSGYYAAGLCPKIVLTAHGGDAYATPYSRRDLWRAARRAVEAAAVVVSTSRFVAEHVARMGVTRSVVIYNGADDARYFPSARQSARRRLGIEPDRFVVAYVGNLFRAKGVFELAEALQRVAQLRPLALFAGPGACRGALDQRMRAGGVEARFYGRVEQKALPDIYASSDVVALPTHAEGFPCVLAETMLCGRVLVATPVGGIPEMIDDGRTGLLVPPRDAAALAAALRSVHDDPGLKNRIEAQALAQARSRLTWRINAEAYEDIYRKAISAESADSCAGGAGPSTLTLPPYSTPPPESANV